MTIDTQSIMAIITTVPALAWFVNAFIKIARLYRENESKIKKVAQETTEEVREKAKNLPDKFKETAKKLGESGDKIKESLKSVNVANENQNPNESEKTLDGQSVTNSDFERRDSVKGS